MNDDLSTTSPDLQIHEVTQAIIKQMLDLDQNARQRVFRTALTFFGLDHGQPAKSASGHSIPAEQRNTVVGTNSISPAQHFGGREELPAKDFLFQKQPSTDIERIACLAYYLTHYADTKHFKTIDLSRLNMEAAQLKFSNSAYAVTNAANAGLLAQAGKGFKQLSAMGERYVDALPDREAAKEVLNSFRSRRSRRPTKKPVEAK